MTRRGGFLLGQRGPRYAEQPARRVEALDAEQQDRAALGRDGPPQLLSVRTGGGEARPDENLRGARYG